MAESSLKLEMRNNGVLIIQPQGPLRKEDFAQLAEVVDPWLQENHKLEGVVISVRKFPGWETFSSFISHFKFVNAHEKKVKRVAIAVDGLLPDIMVHLTKHFIKAKIKQFDFTDLEGAIAWAQGHHVAKSDFKEGADL